MWPDPQVTADLVTFTGEILNGKLHFLAVLSIDCLNHGTIIRIGITCKKILVV